MFRRWRDGHIHGVLTDHDLATRTDVPLSPSSYHRTGTEPYMAIDLLQKSPPPAYLYRHDLESLYYVLVCIVCSNEDEPLQDWFSFQGIDLARQKVVFFAYSLALTPRHGFGEFTKWIVPIHRAFQLGIRAQQDDE